jgi:hypothetical protein
LHTFAAVGKSMSGAVRSNAQNSLFLSKEKEKATLSDGLTIIWHPRPKILKLHNLIAYFSAQDLRRDRPFGECQILQENKNSPIRGVPVKFGTVLFSQALIGQVL